MCEVIKETTRTARKPHECMASVWLTNSDVRGDELTFTERRAVVQARKDKWQILPGQQYLDQCMKIEGRMERIRYRPDIHKICIRLELYECV